MSDNEQVWPGSGNNTLDWGTQLKILEKVVWLWSWILISDLSAENSHLETVIPSKMRSQDSQVSWTLSSAPSLTAAWETGTATSHGFGSIGKVQGQEKHRGVDWSCRMGQGGTRHGNLYRMKCSEFSWKSWKTTGDILFLGNYTQKYNQHNQNSSLCHHFGGLVHELKTRGYGPQQENFPLTRLLDRLLLPSK